MNDNDESGSSSGRAGKGHGHVTSESSLEVAGGFVQVEVATTDHSRSRGSLR